MSAAHVVRSAARDCRSGARALLDASSSLRWSTGARPVNAVKSHGCKCGSVRFDLAPANTSGQRVRYGSLVLKQVEALLEQGRAIGNRELAEYLSRPANLL